MSQRKKGIILSYTHTLIHIIVNLLYVPILLKMMGQSEYGLYQLLGSLVSYISIMESVLSAGILRYYCKYSSVGDVESKENILAISRRIYQCLSGIVLLLGIAMIFLFDTIYRDSLTVQELNESKAILCLLIINIIINLLSYVYSAVITAHEHFVFAKVLLIIATLFQPIAVVCVLYKAPYAYSVVVVQLAINIVVALCKKYYAIHKVGIKIKFHYLDKNFIKQLFVFSLGILLVLIADQIFWKADQLIIGKIMNTSAVAVYAIGAQIYLNYTPIGTAISGVFMPRLSVLYDKEHNMTAISELFTKVGRLSFMLLSLVLSGFALFGKEFIELWVGKGYELAYYIALIVMIPFTVNVMQNMGLSILQLVNKYSFRGKLYITLALFNVITTIFLVKYCGIIGASCSTAFAIAVGDGVVMNWYYEKKVGLDMKRYWKEIAKIFPSAILAFGIGYIIKSIRFGIPHVRLCIHIVIYTMTYTCAVYFLALNKYEKGLLKNVVSVIRRSER